MQSHLRLHFNNEEASDEQVSLHTLCELQEAQCGPRPDWRIVSILGNCQVRWCTEQTAVN